MLAVGGSLFVGLSARAPGSAIAANRWAFVGFAVVAAVLLWRLGGVFARPSDGGLLVRNILRTRRLAWPEILGAHMALDDPWVVLDLADGTAWPVMAVQRADGQRGMREARRLARLITERGEATEPPGR